MSTPQMPDTDASYEASLALIESWGRRAQEQVESAEALERDVTALRVSRWSPGRTVRVTLDNAGLLTDIEFADAARSRSAAALSREALTALRGAMDDLQARVAEVAADHAGTDGLASTLVTSYDRTLSAPLTEYRPTDDAESHPTLR
ncbi:YbaB/EbfC family nucleoid-associated protein [Sanguibacter sp. 25GB23B1]|uniref:YbaB/EbfC family nucleoid-associated protein n=1 Tax=unclassified Sanguibacter TaxID=2645534 RepID=UPI0032AEE609